MEENVNSTEIPIPVKNEVWKSEKIDKNRKEVKLHDFSYTFDEIIAVANQLKAIS